MELNDVLQRVKEAKKQGDAYQAKCPCHQDETQSMTITPRDGKILIYCHAGCRYEDIIKALGLDRKPKPKRKIVAEYNYTDAEGKLLFQTIRFDPKGFSARCPNGNGGWTWSLKNVKKTLYNLPAILQAISKNKFIFIVEGEKDANTLINKWKLPATTNPLGAKKWINDYTKVLKDARVCIIPDNDEAGLAHIYTVAEKIHTVARETRIIELPGLKNKQDVTDWFDNNHTLNELKSLALNAPLFTPQDPPLLPPTKNQNKIPPQKKFHNRPLTDAGNAERFVDQWGDIVKFNHTSGKWLLWNGKYWEIDLTGKAERFCLKTIRSIYEEARALDSTTAMDKMIKHAISSESGARLNAALTLSKTAIEISSVNDQFDQMHHIINFQNGSYNLDEQKFEEHQKGYLITKHGEANYDPDARCPKWEQFLSKIFDDDEELIHFIQKAAALSFSGFIEEQILFFCYGTGANGKSTFFETLRMLAGDYFQKAPTSMLLMKQFDGPSNDIARLVGARFVVAAELPSGKRLNEQVIKDLTGDDIISARFLHQEFFEFKPTHKLWIYGNHKPRIIDRDEGIWRRICLIPFKVSIPKSEQISSRVMKENFKKEMSGILNWMLEGWRLYKEEGLKRPDTVTEATEDYQHEGDFVGAFIEENCIEDAGVQVELKDLYLRYYSWCEESKEKFILSKRMFSRDITERGFGKFNGTQNKVMIKGLGLLEQDENKASAAVDFDNDSEEDPF